MNPTQPSTSISSSTLKPIERHLTNQWYFACLSSELKGDKLVAKIIAGEPVVLFRDKDGVAATLRDICPHRGIPLSHGRRIDGEVECPYHGWKFSSQGVCTEIPSIATGQTFECTKIKVRKYSSYEFQGMVWIFLAEDKVADPVAEAFAPKPPSVPFLPKNARPRFVEIADFPCAIDHAVIGLMDPAHGPFIHKSWFWRSSKSIHDKKKLFKPIPFGFQMARHEPSKNSKAYRILGGKPTTEISFQLPATRTEHVAAGSRNFYSYTALTPVSDNLTRVTQLVYWDSWIITLFSPFIRAFAKVFLGQDQHAVERQQQGLKWDPTLILIPDADTQAKWYFRLKEEWLRHQKENTPDFINPVKETTLQWRS